MVDFSALRTKMVDGQVRPNDVTDLRIIEAMGEVARETFAPDAQKTLAYLDRDLPLTDFRVPRVLMQPTVFARLLQEAGLAASDKVLDVGTGSGYGAAVIARIAASVVALESDVTLLALARRNLADLSNVAVVEGALEQGAPSAAPFDVILLNGAVEQLPKTLSAQLAPGGRLLAVVGEGNAARAMLYRRDDGGVSGRMLFNASLPLLPGFAAAPAFAF